MAFRSAAQWSIRRRRDHHIAHWRSVKFTDHWEEEEEDGIKILHDRQRFSHELTLVFANGKTEILTYKKKTEQGGAYLRSDWFGRRRVTYAALFGRIDRTPAKQWLPSWCYP